MRTDLFSHPVSSREARITCQVNKMGCNVSKDSNSEKNKKSQTNSTHSSRHSAENNGDSKSQILSLVKDSSPPVHNSPEQIDSTEPIDINTPEINQAEKETEADEKEVNETKTALPESQIQQSILPNMQASEKAEAPLDDEIDPDDPEMNQAAAKIQASFRGHKVRKDMIMKKQEQQSPTNPVAKTGEEEEIDIDLDDPNVEKAATKIQASFRGHMVRKQVIPPQKENPA